MKITICTQVETWKDVNIDGIKKDIYSISNYGELKNNLTGYRTFGTLRSDGYLAFSLRGIEREKISMLAHRVVALHFIEGRTEKRDIVNHEDSNRWNNAAENLSWVTFQENIIHGFLHGFIEVQNGEESGSNKYSEILVHDICSYLEEGLSPKQIMDSMNVKSYDRKRIGDLINRIKQRLDWTHISELYEIRNIRLKKKFDESIIREICLLLQEGLYPREIITELNIPNTHILTYRKLINDIRQKNTWVSISDEYKFDSRKLTKAKYSEEFIHTICTYLQDGITTVEILKLLEIEKEWTKTRDLIYDIKRRRTWTHVSQNYIW